MKANEMLGAPADLTGKQIKALASMVAGRTIETAAHEAGVTPQTVHRWLKDEKFVAEYRAMRRKVVTQSLTTLQAATRVAVVTLVAIASDKGAPASSRVSAARAILDTSIHAVEVEDFAARIETLEAVITSQGGIEHETQEYQRVNSKAGEN